MLRLLLTTNSDISGDVVRTAPNEISFATAKSLQDIYGHAKQGRRPFVKSSFYQADREPGIVAERDPEKHRVVRRSLAHAFSAAALRDQTVVVLQYVDMFIDQIRSLGHGEEGIDITEVCARILECALRFIVEN